jgi:putative two-component system response regulator
MTPAITGKTSTPQRAPGLRAVRAGERGAEARAQIGVGTSATVSAPARAAAERMADDNVRAFELAELLESTSDAVVGVSTSGEIIIWGEGAQRLFGYQSGEVLGEHMSLLAAPGRAEEAELFVSTLLAGRRVERVETERVTKDGRSLYVEISLAAIRGSGDATTGVLGVFRDVSRQHHAELALARSERRYESIFEALSEGVVVESSDGQVLASNAGAREILGEACRPAADGSPGYVLVREDGTSLDRSEYPTAITLRTGAQRREAILGAVGEDGRRRWVSIDSSPLSNPGDSRPYAAVASFTDITELRATVGELEEARAENLERLALLAEYRDDETNRHTQRVGHAAAQLAQAIGLDPHTVWTIRRAAPLHDIGKVGIPDRVLLKPAPLTVEEFEVMKGHTVIGGRILRHSRAPVLRMARTIALTHHERWDGNGYPHGHSGEAIPITGRLVAVVDAFDAMTHSRPYRGAMPPAHALVEIERGSGSQFDPSIVATFLTLDAQALVDASAAG